MNTSQRIKKALDTQRKMENLGLHIVDSDPFVPMKLQDKLYKLEFSYQAVAEIFQKTGITIGVDPISPQLIVEKLPQLLLAGLRTHHEDEFGDGIDMDNERQIERSLMKRISIRHLVYYSTVVGQALSAVQPDPEQMADIIGDAEGLTADSERPLADVLTFDGSGVSAEN